MSAITYKDAGVDIERGDRFAESIFTLLQRTFDKRALARPGGFGALFSLDYDEALFRNNYRHPVLVSSTDGVGTKLKLAFMTGQHDTVGIDLVAMSVNDVLVQGAEPLFFLDYLATGKLEPEVLVDVVRGIAAGCRTAGCALLGGETAEMPGFYKKGEYDMAGFCVGVVEQQRIVDGSRIRPGDVVLGLPSSGLHSNGYSLARRLLLKEAGLRCGDSLARFGIERTVGEELLTPTRIYVRAVRAVLRSYRVKHVVHGMAHITGGGLPGNIIRILPEGCAAKLGPSRWQRPPIFDALQAIGKVPDEEMYGTFNMGIGMALIVAPYYARRIADQLRRGGESPTVIGGVVRGSRRVVIS